MSELMDTLKKLNVEYNEGRLDEKGLISKMYERYPCYKSWIDNLIYCDGIKEWHNKWDTFKCHFTKSRFPYRNYNGEKCDATYHLKRFKQETFKLFYINHDVSEIAFKDDIFHDAWYSKKDYTLVECEGENVCLEVHKRKMENKDGVYTFRMTVDKEDLDKEGRADYHSVYRKRKKVQGIGVELELECRGDMNTFCEIARQNKLCAENDGSLDEDTGVELIGPIMSLKDYQEMKNWGPVFDIFKKYECRGYTAGVGYGIHVSTSLSLFSDVELSRYVLFFNTCEKLCKTVAQRKKIYSGSYGVQKEHKDFKKEKTRGKYQPVVVDDVRAEVRIFRSTIIRRNFIKNVEFCEAVRFFCKECEDSDVLNEEIATEKFLKFAEREKEQYPHLYKFLVKYDLIK